jgi:hypothetical protein
MRRFISIRLLVAGVLLSLVLTACLEDACITVIVENNSDEAVVVFETECWPLDVTVEAGKSGNLFVLPGEIVSAESEVSGTTYTHIYSNEYDTWAIN